MVEKALALVQVQVQVLELEPGLEVAALLVVTPVVMAVISRVP